MLFQRDNNTFGQAGDTVRRGDQDGCGRKGGNGHANLPVEFLSLEQPFKYAVHHTTSSHCNENVDVVGCIKQ